MNALSAARGVEAVAEEACARAAVDPRVEDMGLDAAALRSASNHAAQTLEEGRGALITVCADVTNLMAWLWQGAGCGGLGGGH